MLASDKFARQQSFIVLTIHVDFCSQKGLIKSVEPKLFPLVQHGWSLNCSKQSNCSRQMLHSKTQNFSGRHFEQMSNRRNHIRRWFDEFRKLVSV